MTVSVEIAKADEATFRDCMDLGLTGLKEFAVEPINFQKACEQAYLALAEGMTFIARDEEAKVVGFLAMYETAPLWYSDKPILLNRIGPYIAPSHRFGIVGVKLMKAVRALADEKDLLAYIWNTNERMAATPANLYASVAGYVPVGKVKAIRAHHRQQEAVAA